MFAGAPAFDHTMAELAAKPARVFVVWKPVLFRDWSSPSMANAGLDSGRSSRPVLRQGVANFGNNILGSPLQMARERDP